MVIPCANTALVATDQPPFSAFLHIVSFTATITISVSISASQGFATAGNFFGIGLGDNNGGIANPAAVQQVKRAAAWLSWSAAVSALSLMITLVLQLLLTDAQYLHRLAVGPDKLWNNAPKLIVGLGSWIALVLQAAALGFIGEALKSVNYASGATIQVCIGIAPPSRVC
jgi:hypothetical protein